MISPVGNPYNSQQGFTYLMVLAALIVVGILAETATLLNSRLIKAEREQELIFRGLAYRNAIASYYHSGPGRQFPHHLEDLLYDPRFLYKRHIRQLYQDPVADSGWLLLRNAQGGITGVVSSMATKPLRQNNFPDELRQFEGAESYRDWIFEYRPNKATIKK